MDSNVLLSTSLNDLLIEEEDHSVHKEEVRKKERERERRKSEEEREREKPYEY